MTTIIKNLIVFFLVVGPLYADESKIVAVGEASFRKDTIAIGTVSIQGATSSQQQQTLNKIREVISSDFSFYKKVFAIFDLTPKSLLGGPDLSSLKRSNIDYFVGLTGSCLNTTSACTIKTTLYNVAKESETTSFDVTISNVTLRSNAHIISDKIYKAITGKPYSTFLSKIVFISDRNGTRNNVVKELYVMDFDGENIDQITNHRGIAIAPAISNDHTKILYSLIKENSSIKTRNIDLYLYDTVTKSSRLLSSKPGMNSGAVFLPDGKQIALTISNSGNAEIYIMNLDTGNLRKVTNHYAPDVDPSVSIDGRTMTFLSGRPGKAEVYTMDISSVENDVKRISFVGKFNATPRFSPDGKEIAFSSWLDDGFDIFRINTPGTQLVRLTKNFGSNEDPSFSPDGQFIAFSSLRVFQQKRISQNIYVMDKDGEIIKPLTQNFGNCITARWSN